LTGPKRRGSALLTDAQVRAKGAAGKKLTEDRHGRGAGSLVVRWGAGNARLFYFRYTDPQRKQHAIPLGVTTLPEARAKVDDYARRAREARAAGIDLREMLKAEDQKQKAAEQALHEAETRAAREAQRGTLTVLLDAYVAHLERAGKQAAGDARRMFARHVYNAHPDLAQSQAATVTPAEVAAIVRTVVDLGKGRTAGKLRSYLRAAYALAQGARLNAAAPVALLGLCIENNPVASVAAMPQFNLARDRTLSDGELGYYALALERSAPSPARDALRLSLLLGGQRPTQLLRAGPGDVNPNARTLTLRDGKGKRTAPRLHVLPLSDTTAAILEKRQEECSESLLFTADGKRQTRIETCEELAGALLGAMAEDEYLREKKALGVGIAQLRDVRRTAETMLARLGVSRDVRAQLQSHGLGGVQQRHYDRHDYMAEKRAVLETWESHVAALVRARKRQEKRPVAKAAEPKRSKVRRA
jgi:integrase